MAAASELDEAKTPPVEPSLWEPRLEKGGLDWGDMVPLSAFVVRKPRSPESGSARPGIVDSLYPMNIIRPFFSNYPQTTVVVPAPNEPPPEALQVAVMIAMPSANPQLEENDSAQLSQLEIGITRVQWETEVGS